MASPRPYVVAAAGAVLAAVYFVPSASASPGEQAPAAAHSQAVADDGAAPDELADTGAMDTKPYLIGGAGFLVVGAGLLVNATRRSRQSSDDSDLP